MKRVILAIALLGIGCASAPPNLSPLAQTAFRNTQVVKSLDLIRDIAIDANAQKPAPLISTDTTRKVVQFHQSALKVIDATSTGWRDVVLASLNEVYNNLPPGEKQLLGPYFTLAITTLKGLTQ